MRIRPIKDQLKGDICSVADSGCLSRIRRTFFHPGSKRFPDPGSGSTSKNRIILTQNIVSKLSEYDQGRSSRIRILISYPSRIQGPKRHRIPDLDPQDFTYDFIRNFTDSRTVSRYGTSMNFSVFPNLTF
jgi:hypothetical protein